MERELPRISPHLRLIELKLGFWRIYWKDHYIHECYEEMPQNGYDIESYDPRIVKQSYYEEFEDHPELVRKIKNFVEGYWETIRRLERRIYMLRHSKEFFDTSHRAFKNITVK